MQYSSTAPRHAPRVGSLGWYSRVLLRRTGDPWRHVEFREGGGRGGCADPAGAQAIEYAAPDRDGLAEAAQSRRRGARLVSVCAGAPTPHREPSAEEATHALAASDGPNLSGKRFPLRVESTMTSPLCLRAACATWMFSLEA